MIIPYFKNFNLSNLLFIIFSILLIIIIVFLWFKIQNMETYIYILTNNMNNNKSVNNENKENNQNINNMEDFNMADILMNEVFCNSSSCCNKSNNDIPIIHHFKNCDKEEEIIKEEVEINEEKKIKEEKKDDIIEIFDLNKDDEKSVSDINTSVLTKTKLSKLSLDKLKNKCIELNLDSEGSKNQLIERLLSQSS